ncbi:MAG TPA: glycosyltransferase family 4 protein [Candidatus Acidoferrales bacterium]|nr:glycosyltransferase family 4 protein [Candidatus Acidoferrales bacterium]
MYQTSRTKGQELVAQRMVRYFRNLGNEAYLITSVYHDGKEAVREDQMGGKGFFLFNDAELDIPIIRVASLVTKWPPRRIAFKDIVHTLERIVNEFQLNVLITHSTLWNGPEEVAKFVEWRRNIKALGGIHAPLIFCHMSHFQEPSPGRYSLVERSYRIAWNRLSLRTILRVANLILVVTPLELEAKVKLGAPRDRCILFPGGIDDLSFTSYSSSDPKEFLRHAGLLPDARITAFVGTIEDRKNPAGVLEVAQKLRGRSDIRFLLAGRGDSEYSEVVKKTAESLPNVTYLGEISEREKTQLIQNSYLNLILSKMEALGLSQLEFMFGGVPVITSGVGGQAWIVEDGKEGLIVKGPNDTDGAVRAITDLVNDPAKWKKLSENAREKASKYTLTKLMVELDEALTKEMEKESGLSVLPIEVRSTIAEPEDVVRSWSHGSRKVAATERRVFIQNGHISRSTLELPYSSINSIEHIRRIHWKAFAIGALLSGLMFIQHYVAPIVARTLTSHFISTVSHLAPTLVPQTERVISILWIAPIAIATIILLIGTRKGFTLHGATLEPIHLPASFGEAIQYIREMQNKQSAEKNAEPVDLLDSTELVTDSPAFDEPQD